MRRLLAMLAFSSACLFCVQANAVVFITDLPPPGNLPGSPPVGTTAFLENFNGGGAAPAANHLANFSDLALNFTSNGAKIEHGSLAGQYQAPFKDDSNYLTIFGGTTETITLKPGIVGVEFGLYIGSLDAYNSIKFYDGSNPTPVASFTGADIAKATGLKDGGGTTGYNSNRYVEFANFGPFTSIVLGSKANSFEMDNLSLAYTGSLTQAVPETSTWVMMILGFFGVGLARYHRRGLKLRSV